jgi:hypothetical protein
MRPQPAGIDETVDLAQQMIIRDMPFGVEAGRE